MKFRTKITICMVWLLALAYGIGGSLLISTSFSAALEKEKDSARRSCQLMLNALSVVQSYSDVPELLRRLDQEPTEWSGIRITAGSAEVYRSGILPEELIAGIGGDRASVLRVRGSSIAVACPVGSSLADLHVIAVYDITEIYAQRDAELAIYRWTFAIVAAAGTLLSWALCTWLTRPLRALTRVSRELAAGNLGKRVRVTSHDEVGQLSAEFNVMADRLEAGMQDMKAAMERQEEFMGSFAHELKTPMTSIIGYADLLRSQELTEADRREAANYVFSEGKRLESLSLKLLDLLVLEKDSAPMQLCSPKALIEDIAAEFYPILRQQGIALSCRCARGSCLLEPDLFKSLLFNLIDNARKAMDGGGRVMLQSEMLADGVRIRVIDNGRGMPPEALSKITEAFYRVDKSRSRAQGGAGLGLALCSRIVELHKGTIAFSSREGVGTVVTLELHAGAGDGAPETPEEGGGAV